LNSAKNEILSQKASGGEISWEGSLEYCNLLHPGLTKVGRSHKLRLRSVKKKDCRERRLTRWAKQEKSSLLGGSSTFIESGDGLSVLHPKETNRGEKQGDNGAELVLKPEVHKSSKNG